MAAALGEAEGKLVFGWKSADGFHLQFYYGLQLRKQEFHVGFVRIFHSFPSTLRAKLALTDSFALQSSALK